MKKTFGLIFMTCLFLSCEQDTKRSFDLQGHRGCRGLMPENSVAGFIKAMELGVNTLEMDLGVTADRQLVLTHEPYMSAEICLDSTGAEISDSSQYSYNIYQLTYDEVREFDCGMKPHPRFPDQQKITVFKPTLATVVNVVKGFQKHYEVGPFKWNIEIKSSARTDDVYHPAPKEFSDLVYKTVDSLLSWKNVTIQSFDFRVLQYFHKKYPDVNLALLIENTQSIDQNLDSLGFIPNIYSCDFQLLSRESVVDLQAKGMKVIPWTVNQPEDMKKLMTWGVDGLITDYPNRFNELKDE